MNVLVITRGSWNNNNNTGNTMSNLFADIKEWNIYNLYFRSEKPDNKICKATYQISEQQLIKNIFSREPSGNELLVGGSDDKERKVEETIYNSSKKSQSRVLWFARELIWTLGTWKNEQLLQFLEKVEVDVIFMPVFGCYYPHKVLRYIKGVTNAKVVLFHADDNYTLKQFSLSPIYWIYRLGLRRWVKNSVRISDLNYCISEMQVKEYQGAFGKSCKLLYKGHDFTESNGSEKASTDVLQFVYTGNISAGRWKTLSLIGRALEKINQNQLKAQLVIYTATPMTRKMKESLSYKSIVMKGSVQADRIPDIQENADVLVHVESFELKHKLEVRMSFSTKIVDYLGQKKCILAVGPEDVASINYFLKNDAAVVATELNDIEKQIEKLIEDKKILTVYSAKAWECGKKNHQNSVLKERFVKDMENVFNIRG